jgi:hypothetical protein
MVDDFMNKALIFMASSGSVILAVGKVFNFSIIEKIVPQYATPIYLIVGGAGGFLLYNMFKK